MLQHVTCPNCGKENYYIKENGEDNPHNVVDCIKCDRRYPLYEGKIVLTMNQMKNIRQSATTKTIILGIILAVVYWFFIVDFVNYLSPHRYIASRDKVYSMADEYDSDSGDTYKVVSTWVNPKNQFHQAHYKSSEIDWYDPVKKIWHKNEDPLKLSTLHLIFLSITAGVLIYANNKFRQRIPSEYRFVYSEELQREN